MKQVRRTGMVLTMVATLGLLLTTGPGNVFAYTLEEIVVLADKIRNDKPGIAFEVWTEGDKSSYQVGDKVTFGFKADKDCYLALINIGTSGRTIFLFPNKWHTSNKVEKGKDYRIPPDKSDFAYKVQGPAGSERVKVIASVEPILVNVESLQRELKTPLELSPRGNTFLNMKDPGVVLKDIGVAFQGIDPSKWATAELKFQVVEGAAATTGTQPSAGSPPSAPGAPEQVSRTPEAVPAPPTAPPAQAAPPSQATQEPPRK